MNKVCFLIRQLNAGGAQRQLLCLARGLCQSHQITILTFYPGGEFSSGANEIPGVTVMNLGKRGRYDIFGFGWRLYSALKRLSPDVIYSFLPVSNILAGLMKTLLRRPRLVWGVRGAPKDTRRYDFLFRFSLRFERCLSFMPDAIVANSYAGAEMVRGFGVKPERVCVIPNGIDADYFKPDEAAGAAFRAGWPHFHGCKLVGLIGRLDPMKGHQVFLEAAAIALRHWSNLRFFCIGSGPRAFRDDLRCRAIKLGIEDQVIWLDFQPDMRPVFNGLDLIVSASLFGEGFSNVLAEAMACARPCVATRVGDAAVLLGDDSLLVPPGDATSLAEAISRTLARPPAAVGAMLRERVVRNFSPASLVNQTRELLCKIQ